MTGISSSCTRRRWTRPPVLVAVVAIFVPLTIEGVQAIQYHGRLAPLAALGGVDRDTRRNARAAVALSRGRAQHGQGESLLVLGDADRGDARTPQAGPTTRAPQRGSGWKGVRRGRLPTARSRTSCSARSRLLPRVVAEHRVERVIVAPGKEDGDGVVDAIRWSPTPVRRSRHRAATHAGGDRHLRGVRRSGRAGPARCARVWPIGVLPFS